jgi:arginyl-tRNA synthetase
MSFEKFRDQVKQLVGKENAQYLEMPKEGQADLALPCFAFAKKYGKNPAELAKMMEIDTAKKIRKGSLVKNVQAAGPYLNFYVNEAVFAPLVIKEIIAKGKKYGSSKIGKGKTVIVDYSSPNIAKPMSVGHLRATLLGQALYNIHKFLGYITISDNHLGDWGTQFGNLLCAYHKWGSPKKIAANPIPELLSLYVKFHEEAEKDEKLEEEGRAWFARLEKGDREAVRIWKYCVRISLDSFSKIYKKLGICFDYQLGESFYIKDAKKIIKIALKKGIAKKEQDAVIIPMNGVPLLIQKSDESTLYQTRELATIQYRMRKFRPYSILYVVGSEQNLHFRQVFHAARLLGLMKDECVHVNFGLVMLPEGRMSTRKGRVVFLEDLFNETVKFAEKIIADRKIANKKRVAEQVAIAAIKYNNLSVDRVRDIVFDWEQALSFEGDTGPYLLYTAVRAKSILRKSKKKPTKAGLDVLNTKEEVEIIKSLSIFSSILRDSLKTCKPHVVANYLYALASQFNEYYHKTKIIGSKGESQRLALVLAVRTVMENGLQLLGIEIPEKM